MGASTSTGLGRAKAGCGRRCSRGPGWRFVRRDDRRRRPLMATSGRAWRRARRLVLAVVVWSGGLAGLALSAGAVPSAAASSCSAAGSTGLTAAVVVTSSVSGISVNATGCDIGLYVPPGTSGITISGVTVTGANDHGIFVQDASDITITGSTVEGNGVAPTSGIGDNKALMLVGTSDSTVTGNTVTGNLADGGIGVYDDGPVDVGAPKPGTASPATGDTVSQNTVSGNLGGCAIVVSSASADNPAAGVSDVVVRGNVLTGAPGKFGPRGPVVGGIVVAGRAESNVTVTGNDVTGQGMPGIVVHSNAPGDVVTGVSITDNTLSGNDWLATNGPTVPAAIVLGVTPIPPPMTPVISGTVISGNTISGEHFGIWIAGATGTAVSGNTISVGPSGQPVYTTPAPGSGYWLVGRDGGVFGFGGAGFAGSGGGTGLTSPVVGLAPTADQGGYWLATGAGSVLTYGDATSFGSLSATSLAAPVVGIASTPLVPAPGGAASAGPSGKGYWLVGADGGVFAFGDAGFYGSMGAVRLAAPVVGMASTPDGHGYWLVGADGGVFAFGDARFSGSMGGVRLAAPVVGIAAVGVTVAG